MPSSESLKKQKKNITFFPSVKLQKRYVEQKISPVPPLTKWWIDDVSAILILGELSPLKRNILIFRKQK